MQQADNLIHTWESRKLISHHPAQSLAGDHIRGEFLQNVPIVIDVGDNADFLRPKVLGHFYRLVAQRGIQGISQAVRNIGAGHQRFVAKLGTAQRRGRRYRGLANTTLAQIKNNTHY